LAVREIEVGNKRFSLSYLVENIDKDKEILFLHGWGSSKEALKGAFSPYLNEYKKIYLDLPGFGNSSSEYVMDSHEYKSVVEAFLKELDLKPAIIVGHSFGGKIATLLNPKLLVLLSSAGIVTKKPLSIRAKIVVFKALKSLFGDRFYKFFATSDAKDMPKNMYETLKRVVNEDFRAVFRSFSHEALLFWGKDDSATPISSAKEINLLIKNSKLYELEGDHFFFLNHSNFIAKKIGERVEEL
jgi:pimeloyl-ACP methyl ester carboxylesterase